MKIAKKLHIKHLIFITLIVIPGIIVIQITNPDTNVPAPINKADKPGHYYEFYHAISKSLSDQNTGYGPNYRLEELRRSILRTNLKKTKSTPLPWIERGPGNVSGRTRALIVDPDDPTSQTWFAGSVSGGIWKTSDGGKNWVNLTENSNIPVLSTSTLAMHPLNHNLIFAGTGEGFGGLGMVSGNGLYLSTDRGISWNPVPSTIGNEDFRYINRIWLDPQSTDTLLVCTQNGIFRSVDQGENWTNVFYNNRRVEDITGDNTNPSTLYAGVNSWGIIKSTDKGVTWNYASKGIGDGRRFEVEVSSVNPEHVFTSVENPNGVTTDIYISLNQGDSWFKFKESNNRTFNYLGNQGWFNNIIVSHPYEASQFFVGGVYVGKFEISDDISTGNGQVLRVDTINTGTWLRLVRFGGNYLYGAIATGDTEDAQNLKDSDWTSIEIQFGPGKSQKAHRFIVPQGSGANVPAEDYTYIDYIEVPFIVWDTEKNRQLMVSFRDNEQDGSFNLIDRDPDDYIAGREYLYIHSVVYSETPNSNIMEDGGFREKMLYFMWPTLPADSIWQPESIPESKIRIEYGKFTYIEGIATTLANDKINADLHVDHHEMIIIETDPANEKFTILDANDGGLGISFNEGKTWQQIKEGYITTQFYGVDKKPGYDEYIGGMQDNGTWQSIPGQPSDASTEYLDRVGGDGFEVIWHPWYANRLIASSYYNRFFVSNDGGENWDFVSASINDDGPFFSKLAFSYQNPNDLFAVGGRGIYHHVNFGLGRAEWNLTVIPDGWSINDIPTSQHQIEVSLADKDIIWGGAGMYRDPELRFFVSTDGGEEYDTTAIFDEVELGYCSGFATHPTQPETAYALFSIQGKPKILKTEDLGVTWKDISGFGQNKQSSNGFPDVMVFCLLVMPDNTNIIWAGTEIGLFESTDNGNTWHYVDNGLPPVSIWEMKIRDNQVLIATHGRGIWSVEKHNVTHDNLKKEKGNSKLTIYPNPVSSNLYIDLDGIPQGEYSVGIYSISGNRILNKNLIVDKSKSHYTENLNYLHTGQYIITLTNENFTLSSTFLKE